MSFRALGLCSLGVFIVCLVIRLFGLGDDLRPQQFWGAVIVATLFSWGVLALMGG